LSDDGTGRSVGPRRDATSDEPPAFEVLPAPGPSAPVVVHVPHAGTAIPADVRDGLLLDDDDLAVELLRMTDHRTDVLAGDVGASGATRFVNRTSRLVVDPERFPADADEVMASRGMGAVYTRGHRGRPLRRPDPERRSELLRRFFTPYATALAATVDELVATHGSCTIVDLHSYPTRRLPYELGSGPRPPLCVGTDPFHTPGALTELVEAEAGRHGLTTARDTPFAGSYVPSDRYGHDTRVTSVMLELRRDTYLDEDTALPTADEPTVRAFVTAVVAAIAEARWAHADRR
jgi:N-formylglutamate deformylase